MPFIELVEQPINVIVTANAAVRSATGVDRPLHCMLVGFMIVQILLG